MAISRLADICDIKNISQLRIPAAVIQQGNTFGTTLYVASHFFIPDIKRRTGCRSGTLGVDQQCIFKRITVQSG
ncbi:MAG: hypothetical protein LIP10_14860 [Clostridiales bacterium]|nr:hypothetical protein [Clostridiales bacterium]